MPGHDIIVVGASAGGVEAARGLVRELPGDLPAALCIVIHVPPYAVSVLPEILSRDGALPATHARDGEPIHQGRVYVAPPDKHLLIKRGYLRVARGPRESNHRPAVDPLFRTAARAYGPRVIGVVLSGTLDDGTAGLASIKSQSGIAIVQHPDDCLHPDMPRSAMENVTIDYVLPLSQISATLIRLAHQAVSIPEGAVMPSEEMNIEADLAELDERALQALPRPGTPSGFACPECGGTLFELRDGELVRYRCRVGHAWSPEGLLSEQSESTERALWTALRALEEKKALAVRLATQAHERGHALTAAQFEQNATDAEHNSTVLRDLLLRSSPTPPIGAAADQPVPPARKAKA
jgi:two-component system chemotaxis response regulator CheB